MRRSDDSVSLRSSLRRSLLRRTPTFSSVLRRNSRLNEAEFRYSLSRLPEHQEVPNSAGAGTDEWGRLHVAVCGLAQRVPLAPGQLTTLHEDVRTLQRSMAGPFIREYLETRLLAAAGEILLSEVTEGAHLGDALTGTWSYFYSHVLPTIEAIFVHIQGQRLSVRQTALVAFRDRVVLPLHEKITAMLEELGPRATPPTLRQMLLVLQSVTEVYPPSERRLQLESLVALAVTPYLGFRGLYENGCLEPTIPSEELTVAQQRRPSVVNDPRRLLLRPLSMSGYGQRADTLAELFAQSADRDRSHRARHRTEAAH